MARRRANPLAWAAVAVVVLLVVLVVRALGGGSDYPVQASQLAKSSAELGADVVGVRVRLDKIERLDLFRELRSYERKAVALLKRARDLDPPEDFRQANGYLLT